MSRRLRIDHDGDIVGVRTRVFVDEVVRTPIPGELAATREVVSSYEITEAVSEIRVHPMKVGAVARADVVVFAHRLEFEGELASVIVRDAEAGTVETRWRVALPTEYNGTFQRRARHGRRRAARRRRGRREGRRCGRPDPRAAAMKPVRLRASNLRTWLDLELELPDGIAAIVGPNGAGKSTLVSVIDLALFGTGREMKRSLSRGGAGDTVEVELVFDHGGERYRVRRSYQVKGAGKPRLDFERFEAVDVTGFHDDHAQLIRALPPSGSVNVLTRETIAETQADLEALLGLSRQTFRASSYLAQGDGAAFTQADPRDRKAILLDALGVRVWDRLKESAVELRKLAEAELGRLLARVEDGGRRLEQRPALEAQLHAAEQVRDPIAGAVEDLEAGIAQRRDELEQAVAAGAERTRLQANVVNTSQRATDRRLTARDELGGLERTIAARSDEAERLAGLEREAENTIARTKGEVDRLVDELAAAAAERATIESGKARCPTCRQALQGDALTEAIAAVGGRLRAVEDRQGRTLADAEQADTRRQAIARDLETSNAATQALMQRKLDRTHELKAELDELEREAGDARAALAGYRGPDVEAIRSAMQVAEGRLAERRRDLDLAVRTRRRSTRTARRARRARRRARRRTCGARRRED